MSTDVSEERIASSFRVRKSASVPIWSQCGEKDLNAVIWDIAPCSPVLKTFRRDVTPPASGFENQPSKKPAYSGYGLHGTLSKMMVIFITTAVRILGPTEKYMFPQPGIEHRFLDIPVWGLLAVLTELYRIP
jgi:hypothetical protein